MDGVRWKDKNSTFDGSLESEYRTSSNGSLTHYIVTDSDDNTVEKTFVNGTLVYSDGKVDTLHRGEPLAFNR